MNNNDKKKKFTKKIKQSQTCMHLRYNFKFFKAKIDRITKKN